MEGPVVGLRAEVRAWEIVISYWSSREFRA